MITVFARPSANDKREVPPGVLELPTKKMRLTSEGDPMEPLSKNAHEPQQEVPEEVLPMDSQPEDSVNPPSSTLDQLQDSIIQHGPRFLASRTRQWLSKIHHNLGHPSINKLQNVLQQQGLLMRLFRVPETSNAAPVSRHKLQESLDRRPCRSPESSMTVLDAT